MAIIIQKQYNDNGHNNKADNFCVKESILLAFLYLSNNTNNDHNTNNVCCKGVNSLGLPFIVS